MADLHDDLESRLIASAVAAAPPLTPEQVDTLRDLSAVAIQTAQADGDVVALLATEPQAPARAA